jgi:hypothetical protein
MLNHFFVFFAAWDGGGQGGGIDLYCTDQPCFGKNTTANPYLYATEATRLIRQQPRLEQEQPAAARALMIFLALHNVHQPVESPAEFVDLYPASDYNTSNYARRIYNGMHSGVEFVVKNVTEELKSSGLWPRTIFILTADVSLYAMLRDRIIVVPDYQPISYKIHLVSLCFASDAERWDERARHACSRLVKLSASWCATRNVHSQSQS